MAKSYKVEVIDANDDSLINELHGTWLEVKDEILKHSKLSDLKVSGDESVITDFDNNRWYSITVYIDGYSYGLLEGDLESLLRYDEYLSDYGW